MLNMNFYSIIFISCFVFVLSFFYDLYNKLTKQSYFPILFLLFCIGIFYSHLNGRLNSSFYGLLTKSYSYDGMHPIKLNDETIYVNHELKSFHHSFSTIIKENKSHLKYLLNFTGSPGFNFFSNLPHPIQHLLGHLLVQMNLLCRTLFIMLFNFGLIMWGPNLGAIIRNKRAHLAAAETLSNI